MSIPIELKIEKWSSFFIERLYHLVKIDEYCDYTIYSASNDSFKVHRVVLNACSDFFCSRPNTDTSITMPVHLNFNAVKSIIMFMYTGKLYYTEKSRMSLLEAAYMLNMTTVVELIELHPDVKKSTSNNCSPLASMSRTCSEKPQNKHSSAKKLVRDNLYFRSPSGPVPASTFINSLKVKDVLSENKPMRFECNANAVPEFIENTFELPKYDSAPLFKHVNIDIAKEMLKKTSDGELIDKTPHIDFDTQTIPSPTIKKLEIINAVEQNNIKSKLVQEVLMKFPNLLQNKDNIVLKILANSDQSQFENIIINIPKSVEKFASVGSDIKNPLIRYKIKPDIMNTKGPWYCNLCGTDTNPLPLESYYIFRRHIVEKHNEREDPRVCVYCGYISIKINFRIIHLYTKHNIQPPVGFELHICDLCEFVASSDNHLKRHKAILCRNRPRHSKTRFTHSCNRCFRIFKSSVLLSKHLKNFHKIPVETKKPLFCSMDSVQLDGKKCNSLDQIEEILLNYEDYMKQLEYHKDQITYSEAEEVTEIETVTLEDALQAVNENVA